jgi:hypothetical protein
MFGRGSEDGETDGVGIERAWNLGNSIDPREPGTVFQIDPHLSNSLRLTDQHDLDRSIWKIPHRTRNSQ